MQFPFDVTIHLGYIVKRDCKDAHVEFSSPPSCLGKKTQVFMLTWQTPNEQSHKPRSIAMFLNY